MANPRVANPIAVRRLTVVGEPDREIRITLGKPRPEPDPSVWMCSYLVEGIPGARRRIARGADALQALQQAMAGAKAAIQASGLACTWESGEPGDIGIPSTVPSFPWSGFSQRIERYIDRQVEKLTREVVASPGGQARAKSKAARRS